MLREREERPSKDKRRTKTVPVISHDALLMMMMMCETVLPGSFRGTGQEEDNTNNNNKTPPN